MKIYFKIAPLGLLLFFASCIKSDYDTEKCPGWYTVTPLVPVEIAAARTVLENTSTTMLDPMGQESQPEVGPDKVLELTKGFYRFFSIKGENDPVSLDRSVLSVSLRPDGGVDEPSEFVGGSVDFVVGNSSVENTVINHDLQTYVQSRQLVLRVKLTGNNHTLVQSLSASVDGIAVSRELLYAYKNNGSPEVYPALQRGHVDYVFPDNVDSEGYRSAGRRLIGLDGSVAQTLSLTVYYNDGGIEEFKPINITDGSSLPDGISNGLDGFMTDDILIPFVIRMKIRLGADLTAEIIDWTAGPEIWMDAKPNI